VAYQLKLFMKVYLVFYVSLLEPYKESNIPGRRELPLPLPCIEIDTHEEYEVGKNIRFAAKTWQVKILYTLV